VRNSPNAYIYRIATSSTQWYLRNHVLSSNLYRLGIWTAYHKEPVSTSCFVEHVGRADHKFVFVDSQQDAGA
jgi:hypothetical protein